jgi:hypothetical protein
MDMRLAPVQESMATSSPAERRKLGAALRQDAPRRKAKGSMRIRP